MSSDSKTEMTEGTCLSSVFCQVINNAKLESLELRLRLALHSFYVHHALKCLIEFQMMNWDTMFITQHTRMHLYNAFIYSV